MQKNGVLNWPEKGSAVKMKLVMYHGSSLCYNHDSLFTHTWAWSIIDHLTIHK